MTVTDCDALPRYSAIDGNAQGHQPSDTETTKSADPATQDVSALPLDLAGYLAPERCLSLDIGIVFNEWESPLQGGRYRVEKTLLVADKARDIQRPTYSFHTLYYERNSNWMLNLLRSSFNIRRTTYDIEQLRLTECCVNEDLKKGLGQDQQLKNFVQNSPKKQAFFVYGTVWGEKVRIRSSHRRELRNIVLVHDHSEVSDKEDGYDREKVVFGVAVLKLTLKGAVLRAEKFTKNTEPAALLMH